jgi:O-acetyl-ADP-ribose deacetylase (regulator of RNase III)
MDYQPNGDIFAADVECIINPVNCQAHHLKQGYQMGLAGEFEKRFPDAQAPFKKACAEGKMKPGAVQLIRVDRATGVRSKEGDALIANVATKDHWKDPSKIEWVDAGLRKLAGALETRGVKSVAIPMLGAGFGKLPWEKVRDSIETHFGPLAKKGMKVVVLGEGPQRSANKSPATSAAKSAAAPAPKKTRRSKEELLQILPRTAPGDGVIYYAGIGARETPEAVLAKMVRVGEILAKKGWILRSGGAKGADSAFEKGADRVEGRKKEIFLPWDGFDPERNGQKRYADNKFSFVDEITPLHSDLAAAYHDRFDQLKPGSQSLMARNGSQMLGRKLDRPSNIVICWTEGGQIKGGTGQALRMAEDLGAKVVNIGDPAMASFSPESIVRIAEAVLGGAKVGPAITSERVRQRRLEAMER